MDLKLFKILYASKVLHVPLRFRKTGRVWCGGAREIH